MSELSATEITMIAAVTKNNVIGADGDMPFRLKSDMRHFRETTMGKPVVMGRKTWESLPKPLEGRRNIVMTRDLTNDIEEATLASSVEEVLALCDEDEEIMVIGGGEIYRLWLPRADRILLSRVDVDVPGDTTFPPLDPVEWHCIRNERQQRAADDDYAWTLMELVRHYEHLEAGQ